MQDTNKNKIIKNLVNINKNQIKNEQKSFSFVLRFKKKQIFFPKANTFLRI